MIDLEDKVLKQETNKTRWLYRCYCNRCGCDRGYKRKTYADKLCKKCFGHVTHTGRKFSEETKRKMSENHYIANGGTHPLKGKYHTQETKDKISVSRAEYDRINGNTFLGKHHTQETINILSAKNVGRPPKWKGRTFQYDGPKGYFKMRSSYELFYATWMDNNGMGWSYEAIFKLSNGKMFSPDFKLDDGDIIVEIKGYWTEVGLEKWTLFCRDNPDIPKRVLMKDDLIQLGMKEK